MLAHFNRIRISRKLPAIMVTLTAFAITLMGVVAYQNSRSTIQTAVVERLSGLAASRAGLFESWLDGVETDLGMQAGSPTTATAFLSFGAAWEHLVDPETQLHDVYIERNPNPLGERQLLVEAETDLSYGAHHGRIHPYFSNLLEKQGYSDVYLIDPNGNVIYSVTKHAEFATNVVDGPFAGSGLGEVFRAAVAHEPGTASAFSDFAPYGANQSAASFVAEPAFDMSGRLMGVVAYQLSVDSVDAILSNPTGLGATGATYLIGDDFLMRSNSRLIEQPMIFEREVRNEATESGFSGEAGHAEVVGHRGTETVAYFQPISFAGIDWVLIAEQDTAELFAPAIELRNAFVWQAGLMIALAVVVSILLSRNISSPLANVGDAMRRVAQRDYDVVVPATEREDEIGGIALTLQEFRDSLSAAEALGREAAFKGAAYEGSSSPMMITDTEFRITFANRSMKALLVEHGDDIRVSVPDFDPDAVLGRNLEDFGLRTDGENAELQFGEARVTVNVSAVRDDEDNHLGYVTEWQDVTRIRRTFAILSALDANQVWIDMDGRGEVVGVNEIFCNLFDVARESVIGRRGEDIIAPDGDAEAERSRIDAAMADGRSHFGRFHVSLGGDAVAVIEGSLTPVLDTQGRITRRVLIANDVTEARAAIAAADDERRAAAEAQAKVVQALGSALEQLSDGDMTAAIDTAFAPEYERLREDFNRAVDKLLSAMRSVVENSGAITGEVQGITQASNELSARTENQAATLEQTAAALDELTASVKSSAERAAQAAQVVQEARSSAEDSGTVVREAVAAMGEIEESSKQISKIIGVIDDIAFQTNLLALNAGVEAARAGDAGRGFAVVASEVRALAQRSSDAAREINGLISSSGAQVKRGVDLVGEAGKALERIVASVGGIASHVGEIASSSGEQSQGLVEINQAMSQLDHVTQQNAAMFEETSAASQALAKSADALSETVTRFRTDAGPAAPIPFSSASRPAGRPRALKTEEPPRPERKAAVNAVPEPAAGDDDGWAEF